ncbi:MAG TPA: CapA family protein [Candidatus Saccharimonadales bacterium]
MINYTLAQYGYKQNSGYYVCMRKRVLLITILVVLTILATVIALLVTNRAAGDNGRHQSNNTGHKTTPKVVADGVETKIMFVGDVFWGRAVNRTAQASALKEAYPFSRLNEFRRENYDAWVGDLECPSVPGVNQPYAQEVESLQFNCSSAYLPELAKWFTAVSLSNNHTSNQNGQSGLVATRKALEDQKIQYFGHYNPEVLGDVCEVMAIPARMRMTDKSVRAIHVPVAMCGYHGLSTVPSAESLAVMKRYSAVMPVIAYPHMGTEYMATVDSVRRSLYRAMVDNGADAVMGGHPHWVQPSEVYKDKLIVYSMGNFLFDQGPGETRRGAAISLTLSSKGDVPAESLSDWAALGETCVMFRDDCLVQAEQKKLKRVDYTFAYTAQGLDISDRATHPADAALNKSVLERLGWQDLNY